MTDLAFTTATDLVEAIRRRDISSREVLDELLRRIAKDAERVNAVVTLDEERARAQASAADEAAARGELLGPMHGLPITVKDLFEVAGVRTTAGTAALANHVPERDAEAVALLRAAGGVVFGKSNAPDINAGNYQAVNDLFGATNNPWSVDHSPGGSSGGSAAAVAAGHSALDLGSDIAGSVRLPAAWCGVYGHKPSYGIVPFEGHVPPLPGRLGPIDMCVAGVLARSADDLDLALDVLAQPERDQRAAWRVELPAPRRTSLRDYRVGVWFDDDNSPVDDAVRSELERTVEALRAEGVIVDQVAPVDLRESIDTFIKIYATVNSHLPADDEFAELVALARSSPEPDGTGMDFLRHIALSTARDVAMVREQRARIRAEWADYFSRYDVLLAPISQTDAPPHMRLPIEDPNHVFLINGQPRPIYDMCYGWGGALVNLPYLPATAVPVGESPRGLPIGIQVVAPYLEDRTAIDFARRLGKVIGGFRVPPGF